MVALALLFLAKRCKRWVGGRSRGGNAQHGVVVVTLNLPSSRLIGVFRAHSRFVFWTTPRGGTTAARIRE